MLSKLLRWNLSGTAHGFDTSLAAGQLLAPARGAGGRPRRPGAGGARRGPGGGYPLSRLSGAGTALPVRRGGAAQRTGGQGGAGPGVYHRGVEPGPDHHVAEEGPPLLPGNRKEESGPAPGPGPEVRGPGGEIGRASCRERV